MVQFEFMKSLPYYDSESIDFELSDWAAELLERLGICSLSRSDWRQFIKKDLVDRFGGSYGKTLAQIYLNIGLEPPSCLPNIETSSETSDTSESPTFNLHESNTSRKSPKTPIRCSFASTSFSQSSIRVETENNPRSKAVTPAPQLVLIPMSVSGKKESASKTRRKPRTPVKRDISLNKRSFATDASSRR
ncbi:unnamed protein product [Mesocestoides corti]|uniref:DEK_C domain-containing protein n=1 Tax=Mesocestoides corti TaxID=53468 RepID=A0A0R3U8J4_MESCO|nr:unnamed protein product [Mesocestoides corti]